MAKILDDSAAFKSLQGDSQLFKVEKISFEEPLTCDYVVLVLPEFNTSNYSSSERRAGRQAHYWNSVELGEANGV